MLPEQDRIRTRSTRARHKAIVSGLITGMGLAVAFMLLAAAVLVPVLVAFSLVPVISQQIESTAQAHGTAQAIPTATAIAAATRASQAKQSELPAGARPILLETFDTNIRGWQDGLSFSGVGASFTSNILMNKQYIFRVDRDPGAHLWSSFPKEPLGMFESFYVSVDAHQAGGAPDTAYGLLVRTPFVDTQWVIFQIADNGYFDILRLQDGKLLSLAPWKPIDTIHPGGWNTLAIRAQDGHTQFFVNKALAYETDELLGPAGSFGMTLMSYAVEQQTIEFDNLMAYSMDK